MCTVCATCKKVNKWNIWNEKIYTAQKMTFSIKDFFGRCDQIRWKLRLWSHLLKNILNGKRHFFVQWTFFSENAKYLGESFSKEFSEDYKFVTMTPVHQPKNWKTADGTERISSMIKGYKSKAKLWIWYSCLLFKFP